MIENNSELRYKRYNSRIQLVNRDRTLTEDRGSNRRRHSWVNGGIGNMDWLLQDIMELLLIFLGMVSWLYRTVSIFFRCVHWSHRHEVSYYLKFSNSMDKNVTIIKRVKWSKYSTMLTVEEYEVLQRCSL